MSGKTIGVDLAYRDAVNLLRRKPRLETLLGRAVEPRPRAVLAPVHAPCAGELTIDVESHIGFFGPRSEVIGGYQPRNRGVYEADFRFSQIAVSVRHADSFSCQWDDGH